jgi:hypothetical protein
MMGLSGLKAFIAQIAIHSVFFTNIELHSSSNAREPTLPHDLDDLLEGLDAEEVLEVVGLVEGLLVRAADVAEVADQIALLVRLPGVALQGTAGRIGFLLKGQNPSDPNIPRKVQERFRLD